jgi:hypothetical protein
MLFACSMFVLLDESLIVIIAASKSPQLLNSVVARTSLSQPINALLRCSRTHFVHCYMLLNQTTRKMDVTYVVGEVLAVVTRGKIDIFYSTEFSPMFHCHYLSM